MARLCHASPTAAVVHHPAAERRDRIIAEPSEPPPRLTGGDPQTDQQTALAGPRVPQQDQRISTTRPPMLGWIDLLTTMGGLPDFYLILPPEEEVKEGPLPRMRQLRRNPTSPLRRGLTPPLSSRR